MDVTDKSILQYVVDAYKSGMISALVIGIVIGVVITIIYYKKIHNMLLKSKMAEMEEKVKEATSRAEKSEKKFHELDDEIRRYQSDYYAKSALRPDSYKGV